MGYSLVFKQADFSNVSLRTRLSIIENRSGLTPSQTAVAGTDPNYAMVDLSMPKKTIRCIEPILANKSRIPSGTYSIKAWKENGTLRDITTFEWSEAEINAGSKIIQLPTPIYGEDGEYLYYRPEKDGGAALMSCASGSGFMFVKSDGSASGKWGLTPMISYYE